jgi:hypothetical protein
MAGGVSVFAKILDKLQIDRGSGVMYDVHDLMLYDAGKITPCISPDPEKQGLYVLRARCNCK